MASGPRDEGCSGWQHGPLGLGGPVTHPAPSAAAAAVWNHLENLDRSILEMGAHSPPAWCFPKLLVGVLKERTEKGCLTRQTTFQENRLQEQSPVWVLGSSLRANYVLGPFHLFPRDDSVSAFFPPCQTLELAQRIDRGLGLGAIRLESPLCSFTRCVASGKLLNLSES